MRYRSYIQSNKRLFFKKLSHFGILSYLKSHLLTRIFLFSKLFSCLYKYSPEDISGISIGAKGDRNIFSSVIFDSKPLCLNQSFYDFIWQNPKLKFVYVSNPKYFENDIWHEVRHFAFKSYSLIFILCYQKLDLFIKTFLLRQIKYSTELN